MPEFIIENGTIVLYQGSGTNVVLPSADESGNPVTAIGQGAFQGKTAIATVTIPDGIITIGGSAFESCTSLTSVIISDGVQTIGQAAFKNCTSLSTMSPIG